MKENEKAISYKEKLFSLWRRRKKLIAAGIIVTIITIGAYAYAFGMVFPIYLHVFAAGSLTVPMNRFAEEFEKTHPRVKVICEFYGSVEAVRQVTALGRHADVVAVSDWSVIKTYMFYQYANWYIMFSRNAMVIAYTDHSKYSDQINAQNWYKILAMDDVTFGRSDPDKDPCGYRTLLVWKLAQQHYHDYTIYQILLSRCPEPTRPKEADLVALLETGQLDYAFFYQSMAVQHNLKYLSLPVSIDLSSLDYEKTYATVTTVSNGKIIHGEAIKYALTIPENAPEPELAVEFVQLIISQTGQELLYQMGQPPLVPAITNDVSALPSTLQPYVTQVIP